MCAKQKPHLNAGLLDVSNLALKGHSAAALATPKALRDVGGGGDGDCDPMRRHLIAHTIVLASYLIYQC